MPLTAPMAPVAGPSPGRKGTRGGAAGPWRVFISCGELSGDLLAADLIGALRGIGPVDAFGITGPNLRAQGVATLCPIDQLNVMGVSDVFGRAHDIYVLIERVRWALQRSVPDVIILVDFPGFHFRLAAALKPLGIPIVQYVAPKAWAWGKKRVRKLRKDFSLVLGILPFERDFFAAAGVNYRFTGCPVVERVAPYQRPLDDSPVPAPAAGSPTEAEGRLKFGLFPGSRRGEVGRILPMQLEAIGRLKGILPLAEVEISVAQSVDRSFLDGILERPASKASLKGLTVRLNTSDSLACMRDCDFALVASGTATLECALIGTPQAVFYRMNAFSYIIAKAFVRIEAISLVNLVLGRPLVPEFIQAPSMGRACDLIRQMLSPGGRLTVMQGYRELRSQLPGNGSAAAARLIAGEFLEA